MSTLRHSFWTHDWNRFKGHDKIDVPMARWFCRENKHHSLRRYLNRGAPADAIIVIYNIPKRDKGQWSKGGMPTYHHYLEYIHHMAEEIGNHSPIVIFEPDALAHIEEDDPELIAVMKTALEVLCATNAKVYVDIGHSGWLSAGTAVQLLDRVHNDRIRGFSLNVSNFQTTNDSLAYGGYIASASKYNHFVIDTSRNGNGPHPDGEWCNPEGRKFGELPQLTPHYGACDAFLWIKTPGESDGKRNGPKAGNLHSEYLKSLY